MDIGPAWRAMLRNNLRFGLTTAQIAVTLAIVANCLALIMDARHKMVYPKAFNEDDVINILLPCQDVELRDERPRSVWTRENLERLRKIPGVRAATSTRFMPFDGSFRALVKAAGSGTTMTGIALWYSDDQLPDVFGAELDEGKWYSRKAVDDLEEFSIKVSEKPRELGPDGKTREPIVVDAVVTRALGKHLFGDGPLVGKMVEAPNGDQYRIVGVMHRYYAPSGSTIDSEYALFVPGLFHGYRRGAWFVARAEPGQAVTVARRIEDEFSKSFDFDESPTWLLSEAKDRAHAHQQLTVALMGILIVLLLIVASLGVAGLMSFLVNARTRQIGVRRALGATTNDILQYFLTETAIVTTLGVVIGSGLAVLLNMGILRIYDSAKLTSPLIIGCVMLLAFAALGAALPPAIRASRISPAIATRNV